MAAGGASSHVPGAGAPPPASDADRVIDAALSLIAQQGWRRLSMAEIAATADLPILNLYRVFPSKPTILCAFFRRIDEAVLATPLDAEADARPRDRIFDLLMRRFDALVSKHHGYRRSDRDIIEAARPYGLELRHREPLAFTTELRRSRVLNRLITSHALAAGALSFVGRSLPSIRMFDFEKVRAG